VDEEKVAIRQRATHEERRGGEVNALVVVHIVGHRPAGQQQREEAQDEGAHGDEADGQPRALRGEPEFGGVERGQQLSRAAAA
jgi:hypothetical protein